MKKGSIVAGFMAPHPPHLVYAENPPQNEPKSVCGWETLRWAYEGLREELNRLEFDSFIVLSPHWKTFTGTHILAVPELKSLSVDPIFPNLFRYHYDMKVDVDLAQAIHESSRLHQVPTKLMKNPDFRVDYGTIVTGHLVNPSWDKPIVGLSCNCVSSSYNPLILEKGMHELGQATLEAVEKTGKRVVLLASLSLSHQHFTTEGPLPEDMSCEHVSSHEYYLWDMKMLKLMKMGFCKEWLKLIPDFNREAIAETNSGGLNWMMAAMNYPDYPAKIHGYGNVIGTGNAIASWIPPHAPAL